MSIAVRTSGDVAEALRRASGAVGDGARMVEWRIDALAGEPDDLATARSLLDRSPAPAIVTCRGRSEGGEFDGREEVRAALLEGLLSGDHPPRYLDLELSAWEGCEPLRTRITRALGETGGPPAATSLILSCHDFNSRPVDLLQRIETMTLEPRCAVVKVAWQARSLRDNLEAFDLLTERRKPMIVLCMGGFGLMSRVLAPKFGGLLTYAADRTGMETAPGQPTVADLRSLYGIDHVGPATSVYGVIGWPVDHSRGPAIHNAGFEAVGFDGLYLPLAVGPAYEHFKATVASLAGHRGLRFRGASVTIPHKENLLRFVGDAGGAVDPAARRIGAANTLVVADDGTPACFNTDAPAALASLCGAMGLDPSGLAGRQVAVLGAGGAARAVIEGLSGAGASVTVFNRTPRRGEALARELGVDAGDIGSMARRHFDVVVNCTPVGMSGGPAPDQSPLPSGAALDDTMTVFDTVYTPQRTPLIAQAEARGATVVTGRDMFLRQAAMQFELWTGKTAPLETFERAIGRQP